MNGYPFSRESSLYSVGQMAAGCLSLEEGKDMVEGQVVGFACKALNARTACVLSLSTEQDQLIADSIWRGDELTAGTVVIPMTSASESPFHAAIETRKVQVVAAMDAMDSILHNTEHADLPTAGPAMVAPLLSEDRVIGSLFVGRFEGDSEFTPAEALLLESLAPVVSLALHNTGLRQEIDSLEKRLARVDAQLLQSAKLAATGKLAASIAHEINNPLQSVQSCIYLVADGMAVDGPNRQYLDIAREELDRIAKIVQRLADLYRPSQDGQRETDLNGLLENVFTLMGKRLQQSNVRLNKELAQALPATIVVADQIKQVAFNLILNAVEAMPEGGDLEVSTRFVEDKRSPQIEMVFKDSGVGIAPEALERIFDPFYTTKAKGTGLGLSISYDIIERHGGQIHVDSVVGRGSVFTVSLPFNEGNTD